MDRRAPALQDLKDFQRIVITGANGAGKTWLANHLSDGRAVWHFDAMRLTTDWKRRPEAEVQAALDRATAAPSWIIEGGPSLLPQVLPRADVAIWLQPALTRRAFRLLRRAWQHHGQTRPELPPGNTDRFPAQMRFALQSLWAEKRFAQAIANALADHPNVPVVRLRHIDRSEVNGT